MRAPWASLLLIAALPLAFAQQPAGQRLLVAVRGAPGEERLAAELAEACRAALVREGFAALPAVSATTEEMLGEAERLGADFVVVATAPPPLTADELVVEATLTSVASRRRVATVVITGSASLGVERKAARIAREIGVQLRSQAAAPAAAAPTPPPAAAPPAPPPPAAVAALPTPLAAPPPPEARASLDETRARLRRDLEQAQQGRRRGTIGAATWWGLGAAALGYAAYQGFAVDRKIGEEGESRTEGSKQLLSAFAATILGGGCLATGTTLWFNRPDAAGVERELRDLDAGRGAGDPR